MENFVSKVFAEMPQIRKDLAKTLGTTKVLSSNGLYKIVDLQIASPTEEQIRIWIKYNIDCENFPDWMSMVNVTDIAKKIVNGEWINTKVNKKDVWV